MLIFYMSSLSGLLLMLVITAILQLFAVWQFRNMIRDKRANEQVVNLKMLYLHASAFGLFIASEIFYAIMAFTIAIPWQPYKKHDNSLYIFGGFATSISSFFA